MSKIKELQDDISRIDLEMKRLKEERKQRIADLRSEVKIGMEIFYRNPFHPTQTVTGKIARIKRCGTVSVAHSNYEMAIEKVTFLDEE